MATIDKEFYESVRKMRAAQKEYFKTRSKDILNESKKLEKKVDAMLEEYGTLRLFDNDNR